MNRYAIACNISFVLLTMFGFRVVNVFASAQDNDNDRERVVLLSRQIFDGFEVPFSEITIFVDLFGKVNAVVGERVPTASIGSLAVLNDDDLMKELEIVGMQAEDLDAAIKNWNSEREKVSQQASFNLQDYLVCQTEGWKKIDAVLMPSQRLTVAQLQMRTFFRTVGVMKFLNNRRVSEFIGLSESEIAKCKRNLESYLEKFDDKIKSSADEVLELVLEDISSEKRAEVEEWVNRHGEMRGNLLDEIRFWIFLSDENNLERGRDLSNLDLLVEFPYFRIKSSGLFEAVFDDFKQNRHPVRVIFGLLKSEEFVTQLNLTDNQVERLEFVKQDLLSMGKELGALFESKTMPPEEYYKHELDTLNQGYFDAYESVKSILTSGQMDILNELAEKAYTIRRGLFYALGKGAVFQLSSKERDSVMEKLGKAKTISVEMACEIEAELIEECFRDLSEEKKERMLLLLGSAPRDLPVWLERVNDFR